MRFAWCERFMSPDRLPLGIFTTDEHLVVRTWDGWMAGATGIAAGAGA